MRLARGRGSRFAHMCISYSVGGHLYTCTLEQGQGKQATDPMGMALLKIT